MQHDSHEFFVHLLSQLQDEETPIHLPKFDGDVTSKNKNRTVSTICKEYFYSNPSFIDQIFTGITRQTVQCLNCNHDSKTYKPFSVLSLGCEATLLNSLDIHFEVNQFDSENKYKCEECQVKTRAKFYQTVCSLPEVLVFHIKRFEGSGKKITTFL